MKKFYGVVTEFYDNGAVKAAIIERSAKVVPPAKHRELPFADCYEDWFTNEKEAKAFLSEAKAA